MLVGLSSISTLLPVYSRRSAVRNAIFCAVLAFFLAQCSTLTHGPLQRIRVASKPTGASVKLSDCGAGSTDSAKTPDIVFVNRRATHCTLTFSLPEYGHRSVALFRTGRAMARTGPPDALFDLYENAADPIDDAIGAIVIQVGLPIWGMSRAFDGLTGANYRQNRSTVAVDFNKPIRNVAGEYQVVTVNGAELPARTWTARNGKCQIWTNAGVLVLEESGRWRSAITEQQFCGKQTGESVASTSYGVYTVHGDNILLESSDGVASGVLVDDRLELKMAGEESQRASFTLRLTPYSDRRRTP